MPHSPRWGSPRWSSRWTPGMSMSIYLDIRGNRDPARDGGSIFHTSGPPFSARTGAPLPILTPPARALRPGRATGNVPGGFTRRDILRPSRTTTPARARGGTAGDPGESRPAPGFPNEVYCLDLGVAPRKMILVRGEVESGGRIAAVSSHRSTTWILETEWASYGPPPGAGPRGRDRNLFRVGGVRLGGRDSMSEPDDPGVRPPCCAQEIV